MDWQEQVLNSDTRIVFGMVVAAFAEHDARMRVVGADVEQVYLSTTTRGARSVLVFHERDIVRITRVQVKNKVAFPFGKPVELFLGDPEC